MIGANDSLSTPFLHVIPSNFSGDATGESPDALAAQRNAEYKYKKELKEENEKNNRKYIFRKKPGEDVVEDFEVVDN